MQNKEIDSLTKQLENATSKVHEALLLLHFLQQCLPELQVHVMLSPARYFPTHKRVAENMVFSVFLTQSETCNVFITESYRDRDVFLITFSGRCP